MSELTNELGKFQKSDENAANMPTIVDETKKNYGQCFVAIDPECFAPAFVDNLQLFLDQTRGLKPRDPSKSVLVPGDPERMNSERSAKAGGVIYSEGQIRDLEKLAKKQNVGMFDYKANL
ncbi:hypothetical protein niasHT_022424 [Heterodera trifolii]|uniref:Uncharacterized protein n=1 Tax=Heterodera trifolii TaxID=157864 RepID=A0ABD2KMA6_9BILA